MEPVERYFLDQKNAIAGCNDPLALLDLLADIRDELRNAVAAGDIRARLRLDDLQESAENRIAALKARALRQADESASSHGCVRAREPLSVRKAGAPPPCRADEPQRRPPYAGPSQGNHLRAGPRAPLQDEGAPHRSRQQEQGFVAEEGAERRFQDDVLARDRQAAREQVPGTRGAPGDLGEHQRRGEARLAADQRAAAIEAERVALQRLRDELAEARAVTERAEQARRVAEERERRADQERLAAEERANTLERAELEREIEEQRREREQRAAEKAAQRPLPPPPPPPTSPTTPQAMRERPRSRPTAPAPAPAIPTATLSQPEPPATAPPPAKAQEPEASPPLALTGADLARFRAERNLSQRAAAPLLAVSATTIAKAEREPAKVLGPTLQVALHHALRRGAPCAL